MKPSIKINNSLKQSHKPMMMNHTESNLRTSTIDTKHKSMIDNSLHTSKNNQETNAKSLIKSV